MFFTSNIKEFVQYTSLPETLGLKPFPWKTWRMAHSAHGAHGAVAMKYTPFVSQNVSTNKF